MRYMQMIKRCKLPLKKATQDVEAHGEEQAKRCSLTTTELRPSSPTWEERLGHLRHSAVARLLVEGKLPADTAPTSGPMSDCGAAMDLSKSSVLDKARNFHKDEYRMKTESLDLIEATADRIRHQMGVEMEALKTRSSSNEVRFGGWKCRYCPYSTNTSKKLYSHYQFHQQLLTSHSSKPHMEWLAAYRQAKEFSEGQSSLSSSSVTSSSRGTSSPGEECTSNNVCNQTTFFPGGFPPGMDERDRIQAMRSNGLSLRYLLGGNGHLGRQTTEEQNSASGCLRSIVQAVMQQGTRSQTSVTTTSVYTSLINGTASDKGSEPLSPFCPTSTAEAGSAASQAVIARDETPLECHTENVIYKPKPWRPEIHKNNQMYPLVSEGQPCQNRVDPFSKVNDDCSKNLSYDSPVHQTVTVECQLPLSIPTRPLSRESTSSYTSSASSEEINVDDSPSYDRKRIDSLASEYSDVGLVRVAPRKRCHSMDSDNSSLSSNQRQSQQGLSPPNHHISSHQQDNLDFNPVAKMPCLDYRYDLHIKEETMMSPNKSRHSPQAVISSTGTPPPTDLSSDRKSEPEPITKCSKLSTAETGVQCELLVPPSVEPWKNIGQIGPDTGLPDQLTNHEAGYMPRPSGSPALIGSVKCPHCGIMFDDSVLHSIHMGCHSHCDPFICNVCGEQCSNKYGFYTHIMRGHHKH